MSKINVILFVFLVSVVSCKQDLDPIVPEPNPSASVNVLVIDAGEHAANIQQVIYNKFKPSFPTPFDQQHSSNIFFDLHKDIQVHVTQDYDDFNPKLVPTDIVNQSSSVYHWDAAKRDLEQFSDSQKFPKFPLVISSAGNGENTCTQKAFDFAKANGGLSFLDHVEPFYKCSAANNTCPQEALVLYNACDIGSSYVIQESSHKKDWIIVGDISGEGQKPGPILKDRWIATYYSFDSSGGKLDGTSYSVPYVVKIAAEIKRRAPHYTNDEIAQLLFTTADDLGEPGVDEVYGNGKLNPKAVFEEMKRRGL